MNNDTIDGGARDITGNVKEFAGKALDDKSLASEGVFDQVAGKTQKAVGSAKDAITTGTGPMIDQAKTFAKARPFATAALAGVIGIALLNTLRGKR